MSVDVSKMKPGDDLLIRATYVGPGEDNPGCIRIGTIWSENQNWRDSHKGGQEVLLDRIVSHTPKALEVGDRCRAPALHTALTIIAIYEDRAWVKRADGGSYLCDVSSLERVND